MLNQSKYFHIRIQTMDFRYTYFVLFWIVLKLNIHTVYLTVPIRIHVRGRGRLIS